MATKDKSKDAHPLDAKRLKFIEWFRKYRNLYKAAERAGLPKSRAGAIFNEPAVQDEMERQEEAVRLERARQEVHDEKITNEEIDRQLLSVMRLPVEKHGSLKLEAIRLGAVMTGRIQAGNTRALEQGGAGAEAPQGGWSYRATVQVEEAAPILPEKPGPEVPAALSAAALIAGTQAALDAMKASNAETKHISSETKNPSSKTTAAPGKRVTGAIRVG